jgi:hypothetical protein
MIESGNKVVSTQGSIPIWKIVYLEVLTTNCAYCQSGMAGCLCHVFQIVRYIPGCLKKKDCFSSVKGLLLLKLGSIRNEMILLSDKRIILCIEMLIEWVKP